MSLLEPQKPVVLVFTPYYLPGFRGGGPIRSVSNIVDKLGSCFDFKIFSCDRDFGDSHSYENVAVDSWNRVGNADVFYASPGVIRYLGIKGFVNNTRFDLIYLNSCFDIRFALLPLIVNGLRFKRRKPVVLAPRGELSLGALSIKPLKKKLFIYFSRALGLYKNVLWQATADEERMDILREFRPQNEMVSVVGNMVAQPSRCHEGSKYLNCPPRDANHPLKICFLSRIAIKKNLDFALNVLSRVDCEVVFNIYGPVEDNGYWKKCCALIETLPKNVIVSYKGGVVASDVASEVSKHDLFFLPTLGENFGHVFVESLLAGVPLLISDTTPWRGLRGKGVGWDISLSNPLAFVAVINDFAKCSNAELESVREQCLRYAMELCDDGAVVTQTENLFLKAITK